MSRTAIADPTAECIDKIVNDCEVWAQAAAELARKWFRTPPEVDFKADESPVTITDRLIEAEIKRMIAAKYPSDNFLGEETGVDGDLSGNLWVIDPIDGTRSFISGNPAFGMLLAHLADGVPDVGVISMPILNEIYIGVAERQATCNGELIQVSNQQVLDNSVLYINEGEKLYADHSDRLARLLNAGQTRRFGYDCYPHALLAAGYIDAVIDYDLKPYDFLALSVVIEAAGGVMTDWNGNKLKLSSDGAVISAATPELHRSLLDLLAE